MISYYNKQRWKNSPANKNVNDKLICHAWWWQSNIKNERIPLNNSLNSCKIIYCIKHDTNRYYLVREKNDATSIQFERLKTKSKRKIGIRWRPMTLSFSNFFFFIFSLFIFSFRLHYIRAIDREYPVSCRSF